MKMKKRKEKKRNKRVASNKLNEGKQVKNRSNKKN